MWERVKDPMQLTPTGSYWIKTDLGVQITRTIALGPSMTTSPAFNWLPGKEAWFTGNGIDLASALTEANVLSFRLVHRASQPDAQIIATGAQLANTASYHFQLYAISVLNQSDWKQGVPSYGSSAFYFEEENPQDPATMMRLLLDVNPNDPTRLDKLTWIVLDNSVSVYFNGVPDGTTYGLAKKSLSKIPTDGYYYSAP